MRFCPIKRDILKMIQSSSFDADAADRLLKGVDLNSPICDEDGCSTTYLSKAVACNNPEAVKFLLEHGADPNYYNPELMDECALWELQYLDEGQDCRTRYEIQKLLFRYGANPNLECEGERLYDYIVYQVYNDAPGNAADWENLLQFYKLLVIYGGGDAEHGYRKPILHDIDPEKADDYDILLYRCDDGYHIGGRLIGKDGTNHGEL